MKRTSQTILCYKCETLVLKDGSKNKLEVFERKLRKVYESINDNETWRITYNHQLYRIRLGGLGGRKLQNVCLTHDFEIRWLAALSLVGKCAAVLDSA